MNLDKVKVVRVHVKKVKLVKVTIKLTFPSQIADLIFFSNALALKSGTSCT